MTPAVPSPPGLAPRWYFTVGPTQMHPLVPGALAAAVQAGLPSWSHRSAPYRKEVARTVDALRALLGIPAGHRVLFVSSATEAMERIVEGAVEHRSHHLVNGAFAKRFRTVSRNLGREAGGVEVANGLGFDLDDVIIPGDPELMAVTQNETSTGVALDPEGIAGLARRYPGVLMAVDAVTAAPTQPLDLSVVDAFFFGVQKLFGLPAGLGVLVVSPRLVERSRELQDRGFPVGGYQLLTSEAAAADLHETVATPNMLGIHLLGLVAEDFLTRGIETIRKDAREGADRIHRAAQVAGWSPFPPREQDRSSTVLVYQVPGGNADVRTRLSAAGFPVSEGYGVGKDTLVRIAGFPVQPPEAVEALAEIIAAG
jgi:phosphoserine aminotransferase